MYEQQDNHPPLSKKITVDMNLCHFCTASSKVNAEFDLGLLTSLSIKKKFLPLFLTSFLYNE